MKHQAIIEKPTKICTIWRKLTVYSRSHYRSLLLGLPKFGLARQNRVTHRLRSNTKQCDIGTMLTPYRVVFITLAVGLSLNLLVVFHKISDDPTDKHVFDSSDSSPLTMPIKSISPQIEQQDPITVEQISRDTIAQRAYNGALNYCNTKPLNGLAPEACIKFVEQFRSRCLGKIIPTMPLYFDDLTRAVPYGDTIISCLLPPIALPNNAKRWKNRIYSAVLNFCSVTIQLTFNFARKRAKKQTTS